MRAISLVGNFADFSSFPHSPTDSLRGSWHVSSPSSAVSSRRTLLHARITKWQKGWGRKGPQEVFCSLVVIPVGGLAWVKANSPLACRPHCRKPKHQELWGAATRFLGNAKACQGRRAKLNLSFLWSRVRHHVSAQGDSSDLGRETSWSPASAVGMGQTTMGSGSSPSCCLSQLYGVLSVGKGPQWCELSEFLNSPKGNCKQSSDFFMEKKEVPSVADLQPSAWAHNPGLCHRAFQLQSSVKKISLLSE